MHRLLYRLLLGTAALPIIFSLSACGGGGGGGATDKTNTSFQLVVAPDTVTVHQGADALLKVTVTRAANFVDDVTLSMSTTTAGIDTGGLVVSGSMTSGWMLISIAPGVAVGGPVPLTVTGTSGNRTATKALSLTISAAEPSAQSTIASARASGALDAGTALIYRAYALFGDPRLPAAYLGSGSIEEDNGLLSDIRAAWSGLTAEAQEILLPFTLRPSDPGSWYNAGLMAYAASVTTAGVHGAATARLDEAELAVPPQSCAEVTSGQAWVSRRSGSYPARAWVPCSGDPATDAKSMQMLNETLAVIDKVWQPIGELMGDAAGNPILDQDGADEAIDVYIDRGSGIMRAGKLNSVGNLGGQTFPDAPHVGKTHSAFVIVPETQFGTERFHVTIIHELFHVFQQAYNGDIADSTGGDAQVSNYWFYEASATWAGAYFDRKLAPWSGPRGGYLCSYGRFKARFQPSHTSLNGATEELHDYSAFIWPYFLEQAMGGPQIVGQIWKNLTGAATSMPADDVVDAAYSFVGHFREFALRNLNTELLPGDPLPRAKRYITLDPDFQDDKKEPPYAVTFDITDESAAEEFTLELNPLTARYLKVSVTNKNIKRVAFDLSSLDGLTSLDVDALVKINGTWESTPRDLNGKPELKFCLDKPGEKVEEVRFIVSNHARIPGLVINALVGMNATAIACKGGWSGMSTLANKPVLQSGGVLFPDPAGAVTKCVANVKWVFDPEHSDFNIEHYHPEGTVTFSRVDTLGDTFDYSPSVHAIDPDLNNGMDITPAPSGVGFIVTGSASTTFATTETDRYAGQPPLTFPTSVFCLWFGPRPVMLAVGATTISGIVNTETESGGFSFTKEKE